VPPAALDGWFDDTVRDAGIPGAAIAVVQDGRIVHEHAFGVADAAGRPVTPQTPFVIGSLTKSLTALAVGQLVEHGLVDLDAPARRYLPEFTIADPTAGDAITVRELLNQTSGIPSAAGTAPLTAPATTLDGQVRALAGVSLASAPGTAFEYSNANYVVLGRLIEAVSGQSYEAYMQDRVFGPLGMTHTTSDLATAKADGLGQAHRLTFGLADAHAPLFREDMAPAGFVAASADDMAHFLEAELDGGLAGTTSVASQATIVRLWTGVAPAGSSAKYAMGWYDSTFAGERILAHAGSTTDMASFQAVVPSRGLGVVVLFNAQSALYELLHKPDSIGMAALAQLMGRQSPGTLALFYPAFDLLVLVVVALTVRGLSRLIRAPIVPRPALVAATWRDRAMLAARVYFDIVVPLAILFEAPQVFGAGWDVLFRIDVGMVLAVVAGMRAADGIVRGARTIEGRRMARGAASPATVGDRSGIDLAAER
jgi:CubicO group peptidase (beta-lactamase class C family)